MHPIVAARVAQGEDPLALDAERELRPSLSRLVQALECIKQAGDAAAAGERGRALAHYGQAVDEFLEEGLYTMAASTARQMLDRFPDVVRARGTLAVLALAESLRVLSPGVLALARRDFEEYVAAAQAAGQAPAAARHLRLLARETDSPEMREWLSTFLETLGDADGAEEVFLAAYEEREGIRAPKTRPGTQQQRWAAVLRGGIRPAARG